MKIVYNGCLYEDISDVTKKNQEVTLLADRIFNYVRYLTKQLTSSDGYIDTESKEFSSKLIQLESRMVPVFGYALQINFNEIIKPDDKILNNKIINKMVSHGKLILTKGKINYEADSLYLLDIPYYKTTIDELLDFENPKVVKQSRGANINGIYIVVPFYTVNEDGKLSPIGQTLSEDKDNYRSLLIHELTHYYDSILQDFGYLRQTMNKDSSAYLTNETEINARSNELIYALEKKYNKLFSELSTYKNEKTDEDFDKPIENTYHLGFRGLAKYNVPLDKDDQYYRSFVRDNNELFKLKHYRALESMLKFDNKFMYDLLYDTHKSLYRNIESIKANHPDAFAKILSNIKDWFTDFSARHVHDFPTKVISLQ